MGLPGANQESKLKKKILVKKSLKSFKQKIKNFFMFQRTTPWNKFNCPGIFKKSTKGSNSNFHVLNNNLSYAQHSFAFVAQKDFYYVHKYTDTFFLFLLQKDFDIFHMLLSELVFLIIVICHLYIKNYKKYFIGFWFTFYT